MRKIIGTSAFWLLLFGWGFIYSEFVYGLQVHLPAGNPPIMEAADVLPPAPPILMRDGSFAAYDKR